MNGSECTISVDESATEEQDSFCQTKYATKVEADALSLPLTGTRAIFSDHSWHTSYVNSPVSLTPTVKIKFYILYYCVVHYGHADESSYKH